MRRKDREMPEEFAVSIADKCEYACLSIVDVNNMPYGVPISIVREGEHIYFHSALDGFKIDCLKHNPNVCLVCVGDTNRLPDEFTTEYESAIIRGVAVEITDDAEKTHALKLLCERHTPTNMSDFDTAIEKSLFRTAVWRIDVTEITGKRKKYDKNRVEMKFGRTE